MELEESTFLISDYTTKLQPSRQYGTGTKQKYRPMEQDRKPRNKPTETCTQMCITTFSQRVDTTPMSIR